MSYLIARQANYLLLQRKEAYLFIIIIVIVFFFIHFAPFMDANNPLYIIIMRTIIINNNNNNKCLFAGHFFPFVVIALWTVDALGLFLCFHAHLVKRSPSHRTLYFCTSVYANALS